MHADPPCLLPCPSQALRTGRFRTAIAPTAPPDAVPFHRTGRFGLAALHSRSHALSRGDTLFERGDKLVAIYIVHAGQFKTSIEAPGRPSQVSDFHLTDDVLGLDGIGTGQHMLAAVALEDSCVDVLPYAELSDQLLESPTLRLQLWRLMGRKLGRDQSLIQMLGSSPALSRVAAFLLDLSARLQDRGFSPSSLILRMSRAEIGSHLGLRLETVSRSFSRLRDEGVLDIQQRHIQVRDASALHRIAHNGD